MATFQQPVQAIRDRQARREAEAGHLRRITDPLPSPERAPATGQFRRPADIASKLVEHGIDLGRFANMTPQDARSSMEGLLLSLESGAVSDLARVERDDGPSRAVILDPNGADALSLHDSTE